ncbi:MAG: DNA gyrase subunit B, partial [Stenotrophobium sp.]
TYVKDDGEMNEWLLSAALNEARLTPAEGQEALPASRLSQLLRERAAVDEMVERVSRRYDHNVLKVLARHAPVPVETAALKKWAEVFAAELNGAEINGRFGVEARTGAEGPLLQVSRNAHGNTQIFNFNSDFFASADYKRLATLRETTNTLIGAGGQIQRGERKQAVTNFDEAFAWLMSEARRGLHVQRYKGLGEMNPQQLWETTLDPKVRRLVRVRIEDVVSADQIFTTLMGEQVEPRRDFIEGNALLVSNLDL